MTILNQYAYIAEALGWAVLHSVWQVSLAAILVWITSLPVFRLSARARYWVALSTITMALIGFVATFIHYSGHDIQQASGDGLLIGGRGEMAGETGIGLSAAANTARNPLEFLTSHAGIIGLAWGFCFALMFARYLGAYRMTYRLRRNGLSALPTAWQAKFEDLLTRSGARQNTRAYISKRVASPITFGIVKPVILLPVWFFTGLNSEQCEAVLAHELAHIRRFDYLTNAIQILAKSVFFYHPACQYICGKMDIDREYACDDIAVQLTHSPDCLASALGAIGLRTGRDGGALALYAAKADGKFGDMPLLRRLKRLTGQSTKPVPAKNLRAFTSVVMITFVCAAGFVFSANQSAAQADTNQHGGNDDILAGAPVSDHKAGYYAYGYFTKDGMTYTVKTDPGGKGFIFIDGNWYETETLPEMKIVLPPPPIFPRVPELAESPSEILVSPDTHTQSTIYVNGKTITIGDAIAEYHADSYARKNATFAHAQASAAKKVERVQEELAQEQERLSHELSKQQTALTRALSKAETERDRDEIIRAMEESIREFEAGMQAQEQIIQQAEHAIHEAEKHIRKHEVEIQKAEQFAMIEAERARVMADKQRSQYEDMREDLIPLLIADGFMKSTKSKATLDFDEKDIWVNGKLLENSKEGKYCKIVSKYFERKSDLKKIIIKPDSLFIKIEGEGNRQSYTYGTY